MQSGGWGWWAQHQIKGDGAAYTTATTDQSSGMLRDALIKAAQRHNALAAPELVANAPWNPTRLQLLCAHRLPGANPPEGSASNPDMSTSMDDARAAYLRTMGWGCTLSLNRDRSMPGRRLLDWRSKMSCARPHTPNRVLVDWSVAEKEVWVQASVSCRVSRSHRQTSKNRDVITMAGQLTAPPSLHIL